MASIARLVKVLAVSRQSSNEDTPVEDADAECAGTESERIKSRMTAPGRYCISHVDFMLPLGLNRWCRSVPHQPQFDHIRCTSSKAVTAAETRGAASIAT